MHVENWSNHIRRSGIRMWPAQLLILQFSVTRHWYFSSIDAAQHSFSPSWLLPLACATSVNSDKIKTLRMEKMLRQGSPTWSQVVTGGSFRSLRMDVNTDLNGASGFRKCETWISKILFDLFLPTCLFLMTSQLHLITHWRGCFSILCLFYNQTPNLLCRTVLCEVSLCVCLSVTTSMCLCGFGCVYQRLFSAWLDLSRCSSGLRCDVWWDCSLASTCHCAFTRADLGKRKGKKISRIPRFRARSSRSVFNLLTVKLISHPITQQLTPNWVLSFSYGWACTWIYCRCVEVLAPCDYLISKGIGVCVIWVNKYIHASWFQILRSESLVSRKL